MPEMPYHYTLVDVFTRLRFTGNQLAVFSEADGLSDEQMQAIARELNLSETTFVLPPEDSECDYRLRIFTPEIELPMAGHPTIGTAFVLARQDPQRLQSACADIRFAERVGVIPVRIKVKNGQPATISMVQPLPDFGPVFEQRHIIADMLSLAEEDLLADCPIAAVSCGVPFLFVPVKTLSAVKRISLKLEVWKKHLQGSGFPHVFAFTQETESRQSTVHCRMFAPAMGIPEDPATGAASGPLGCYLLRHGLVSAQQARTMISEQGFEIGRPSHIHIEITTKHGDITRVVVGGECVEVGSGVLYL